MINSIVNTIIHGDCLNSLNLVQDNSIDLVITSPPYADRRSGVYGGVSADDYVKWFLPIAMKIKHVLKPTGSFFLNLKPHTKNGERNLYVFDIVLALKRTLGFMFVDEFCWTKNAFPGMLRGRFKNAFEPVYHFTKSNPNSITFNPQACGTRIKADSIARTYRKQCGKPKNGSGMTGMNTTNIRNLEIARPSNVIHVNNVSNQFTDKQLHSATYPEGLVEFFVKSFTNENDIVLDPFCGSGTTTIVAKKLGRRFIGMDSMQEYVDLTNKRLLNVK